MCGGEPGEEEGAAGVVDGADADGVGEEGAEEEAGQALCLPDEVEGAENGRALIGSDEPERAGRPACTDAEVEPSADEVVDGRGLFGEQGRSTNGQGPDPVPRRMRCVSAPL